MQTSRKPVMSDTTSWHITITNGVRVSVAPTIQLMTGYILLEQEDWFEDEMDFIRALVTPDMHVFDIGANHGVIGLTIANQLTSGHVWAFEPTIAPGAKLAESIVLNGFADHMTWVHAGLSDHDGSAEISISGNSETNSLYGAGTTRETIALYGLDAFVARQGIDARVDFVKLDAEGEEIKILAGGEAFFRGQSPLVMFELKHGAEVNHGLIEAFQALGYGIFRLAPGLGALVPFEPGFEDGFLLNLFACKPDQASRLAARGLLVEPGAAATSVASDWRSRISALPFAQPHLDHWLAAAPTSPEHEAALSACLMLGDPALAPASRYAEARRALDGVTAIAAAGKGDIALWLLRLNLCHQLGERGMSVSIGRKLAALSPAALQTLTGPYLPPSPEFYDRDLGPAHERLLDTLREFLEYRQAFSSYYTNDPLEPLSALTGRPGHGLELDRRLVLMARRRGMTLNIPADHPLLQPETTPNHAIWRQIVA
jgi:protein O-GlcNAc transferase